MLLLVDVTVAVDRRPAGIAVHRCGTLTPQDVRTHRAIAVTSPARALLDGAPGMTRQGLARAVNHALRTPFLNRSQLAEICGRSPLHPGTRLLTWFIDTSDGPTRSDCEDGFPVFCERFDLPRPQINVEVCGYEVDAYFPAEGLIVELDGWGFHRGRDSFERDRNRDADTLAAGDVTVRITWERMTTRPRQEADRLKAILAQRRGRAG